MNVSVGIILFICWASLECCPGIDKVNFNGDDDELLRGIIRSVMDGLESVEKHASELVIDSIFTLKVNRDQLEVAMKKLKNTSNPANAILVQCLRDLKTKCEKIIEKAFQRAGVRPKHFEILGNVINANWSMDVKPRPVDLSLLQPRIKNGSIFLGKLSDFCLGKLVDSPRCQVLPSCLEFNTQLGKSEYAITHQLLYFQTGLMFHCFTETPNLSDLLTILCSNIFNESQVLAANNFPHLRRDLFMEQVFLCSMSGFTDFLNEKWFQAIMSWQDAQHGCWHSTPKLLKQPLIFLRREKRFEKRLSDDCLCHETAMALSAMIQFLKHRVNDDSSTMNQ